MNHLGFRIRRADWANEQGLLRHVREQVFVVEQGVPLELEWDEWDPRCWHLLAEDVQGRPIGTGRLSPEGKIGRMAVLEAWRGQGVGSAILQRLIEMAQAQGFTNVYLNAQLQAMPFYEKFGFQPQGRVFEDAGIAHRKMCLRLGGSLLEN